MSRKRTGQICPKCKKPCYFEEKPTRNNSKGDKKYRYYWYAVHFNSGKRQTCYINPYMRKKLNEQSDGISDFRFQELKNSPNDAVPIMIKYDLTIKQLDQLSRTEQRQYLVERRKFLKNRYNEDKNRIKHLEEMRKEFGIPDNSGLRSKRKKPNNNN